MRDANCPSCGRKTYYKPGYSSSLCDECYQRLESQHKLVELTYLSARAREEADERRQQAAEEKEARQDRTRTAQAISGLLDKLPGELRRASGSPQKLTLAFSRLAAFFEDFTDRDWHQYRNEYPHLIEVAYDQLAAVVIPAVSDAHRNRVSFPQPIDGILLKLANVFSFPTYARMREVYDVLLPKASAYAVARRQESEENCRLENLNNEAATLRARIEQETTGVVGMLKVLWRGQEVTQDLELKIKKLTAQASASEKRLRGLANRRQEEAAAFVLSQIDDRLKPCFSADDAIPDGPPPQPGEQMGYRLVLAAYDPPRRLELIKLIREVAGLDLAAVKALVDAPPSPVTETADEVAATRMKRRLEEAGAAVVIQPCSAPTTAIPTDPPPQIEPAGIDYTEVDVVLEGFDASRKIDLIRAVRDTLGVGLAAAKGIVDTAPSLVKEKVGVWTANEMKKSLEAVGAKVSIKPA